MSTSSTTYATSGVLHSQSTTGTGGDAGPVFIHSYATMNVKSHVPVTLEPKTSNFTKWASFFRALCGKFGLLTHINGPVPATRDLAWEQADCCVRSWLFGSVSDAVLDLAMEHAVDGTDQTARELWVAITNMFEANKAPRAIFLSHEFHSMTQGDSSIDDYCIRMKTAADALRDVGQPVSEPTLVLNLLRGLAKPYSNTADNIASSANLTFASARNQLLLKELRLKNEEKVTSASALVAVSSPSCGSSGCRSSSSGSGQQQQQPRSDGQWRNKKGGGGKKSYGGGGYGGGGGQFRSQAAPSGLPAGQWICFSSWTQQGTTGGQHQSGQGWAGQGRRGQQGLLGNMPQAHTAFAPVQVSPPGQSVDAAGLMAALQQMSMEGNSGWVVDTGASAHMSSSDGILL
jgi:hypothetical protein